MEQNRQREAVVIPAFSFLFGVSAVDSQRDSILVSLARRKGNENGRRPSWGWDLCLHTTTTTGRRRRFATATATAYIRALAIALTIASERRQQIRLDTKLLRSFGTARVFA